MFDIWAFLLQTLTASGAAVFLLVLKGLFKDKLPPKWHFLVWSVLGVMVLLPAGLSGRYTLFHWQIAVETIKGWLGDYSFTRILFPIPFINSIPKTVLDWVFVIYVIGIVVYAMKYIISYLRLRRALSKATILHGEKLNRIKEIASEQKIKPCKVIEVPGLPSAFVCGVIRPILAIPADSDLDDKIILHELFHLKHKDTFWSMVICLFRCIHWCNPLLIYCANRAINDMEARCDQYVLECLEGEELRDYGRILLSMTNDRFVKTPGSTCINNGRKNIRDRIEAIARFKKYPAGMGLVSVCVIIVLTVSMAVGVQASGVYDTVVPVQIALASARSTPCTTYAGAFDTYAKAVLKHNVIYRAMCAPAAEQADIAKKDVYWEHFLARWPEVNNGYYIYNLKQTGKNAYEGLLVIKVRTPIDKKEYEYEYDEEDENDVKTHLAVQNLRVQKEYGRWVAVPLEDFRYITVAEKSLEWGCSELPGFTYSAIASDFQVDVTMQTVHSVDSSEVNYDSPFSMFGGTNSGTFNNSIFFNTTPKPNAVFTSAKREQFNSVTHLGTETKRNDIRQIGLSAAPVFSGEKRPENLHPADAGDWGGSSSSGEAYSSSRLDPGWGPTTSMGGGGTTFDPTQKIKLPEYYAADLYINNKLAAQIDLQPQEEVKE